MNIPKAAFTRQTKVGKLVLATQVGAFERHKNSRQTRWQTVGDK